MTSAFSKELDEFLDSIVDDGKWNNQKSRDEIFEIGIILNKYFGVKESMVLLSILTIYNSAIKENNK